MFCRARQKTRGVLVVDEGCSLSLDGSAINHTAAVLHEQADATDERERRKASSGQAPRSEKPIWPIRYCAGLLLRLGLSTTARSRTSRTRSTTSSASTRTGRRGTTTLPTRRKIHFRAFPIHYTRTSGLPLELNDGGPDDSPDRLDDCADDGCEPPSNPTCSCSFASASS